MCAHGCSCQCTQLCSCDQFTRGMLGPALLLMIARGQASHGYQLVAGLAALGIDTGTDTSRIYRLLRTLEEAGLVTSTWDTSGSGPARRVYQITAEGRGFLSSSARSMREAASRMLALAGLVESEASGQA